MTWYPLPPSLARGRENPTEPFSAPKCSPGDTQYPEPASASTGAPVASQD